MISIKRVLADGTELFISGNDIVDFGLQLDDLDIPQHDQDRIFDLFEQFAETSETILDSRPRQLGEKKPAGSSFTVTNGVSVLGTLS